MSILIVIRAAGESTLNKCKELIENSDDGNHVEVITEVPFSKAVKKTFELGLDYNRDWTLAVDADVLVSEHGIRKLVALANSLPEYFFRIEGKLLDRFCGYPRNVGMHLYRTPLFNEATQFLKKTENTLRPESRVVKEMVKIGYHSYQGNDVYGVHDYYQHYRDIFRKTFVFAQKHKHLVEYFKRYWKEIGDDEFMVALKGLEAGLNQPIDSLPDVQQLYALFDNYFREMNLKEVSVPSDLSLQGVASIIADHRIPEYGLVYYNAVKSIARTDFKKPESSLKGYLKKIIAFLRQLNR